MRKNAQGLSITTIIVAALALVVLVIIFAIFTGRISIFGRGITECPGRCEMPYSEKGPVTALDPTAKCNPQFEKSLTGIYIEAGQPANRKTDELVYCSKCCMSIV